MPSNALGRRERNSFLSRAHLVIGSRAPVPSDPGANNGHRTVVPRRHQCLGRFQTSPWKSSGGRLLGHRGTGNEDCGRISEDPCSRKAGKVGSFGKLGRNTFARHFVTARVLALLV